MRKVGDTVYWDGYPWIICSIERKGNMPDLVVISDGSEDFTSETEIDQLEDLSRFTTHELSMYIQEMEYMKKVGRPPSREARSILEALRTEMARRK